MTLTELRHMAAAATIGDNVGAPLARIERLVRGLARMVAADRYCIDVVTQLRAVRAALDRTEQEVLREHLQHCVSHAFGAGTRENRQRMVDELIDVLDARRA